MSLVLLKWKNRCYSSAEPRTILPTVEKSTVKRQREYGLDWSNRMLNISKSGSELILSAINSVSKSSALICHDMNARSD